MRRLINKIVRRIRAWHARCQYRREERKVMLRKCTLDSQAHHVLCIGNSITIHPPYEPVGWLFNHGMAASAPQNDYCHVLESRLKELNSQSTVTPINIAVWEQDFTLDLDELLRDVCKGKDIIVIRLGENVKDEEGFGNALDQLIAYCRQYTEKIVLTGQFWRSEIKEQAVIRCADKYALPYMPIDWIWELYREESTPKDGVSPFVQEHPNDFGMNLIAKAIYHAL